MKRTVLTIIALLWGSLFLTAQNKQVPYETIQEIANRNAEALWGNVDPDEPIPYYSADNQIIAYRFNYAIGNTFPDRETLISHCKQYNLTSQQNKQWGGNAFGRILVGATEQYPVIIEYSRSLSVEYARGFELETIADTELAANYSLQKIYYINEAQQWFCYSDGNETIYINLYPPLKTADANGFLNSIAGKEQFIVPADYSTEWQQYNSGKTLNPKAAVYIPDHELCPFYDWSYGCSPTAAAMLFGWWDYRSIISGWDFSLLIEHYFYRWDALENEWDWQIPWMQRILAIGMDTDTTTGSTTGIDIKDGIEYAAAQRGYSFDASDYVTLEWNRLRDEIDDNRPLVASIPGHSTTGIGYNNSDNHFATHYTHQGSIVWVHKDELSRVTLAEPETDFGQGITLTYPKGDINYNHTGSGEIFYMGEQYNITWDFESSIPSTTTIYYSVNGNGAFVEDVIAYNTDNDGYYTWNVPAGINSDECRIGIINYDASSNFLAMDGSYGMFTIYEPPDIPELTDEYVRTTDYDPDYFKFEHDDNTWCVVGIRNMMDVDWKMKLYNDLTFLTQTGSSNTLPSISEVELIVIDGHHAGTAMRGIKVDAVTGDNSGKIVYDDGYTTVSLGTQSIYFGTGSVAKMYDAHFVPGYYTFTVTNVSGSANVDIALFSSTSGSYIQNLGNAKAISNTAGSGETESFTVYINTEDDYGFCIWTEDPSAHTWELEIEEEHPGIWEGDASHYWSTAGNWSLNIIPDADVDVVIPDGTPYSPFIIDPAFCRDLTIESGANLYVQDSYIYVYDDVLVKGHLNIDVDEYMYIFGDIKWTSTATEYLESNTSIYICGNWTFDYGSDIQIDNGHVRFVGGGHSLLYCRSESSYFNDVHINKMTDGWVQYEMTPGLQPLRIHGDFLGYSGCSFTCPSLYDIYFEGSMFYVPDGFEFKCSDGSFIFSGSSNQDLYFNSESYFNNLVIESSANVEMQNAIYVDGDVIINSGALVTYSYPIEVGGDWTNNVGPGAFYQQTGTVKFNSWAIQECDGEQFYTLEMDKGGGELRFHEGVTECVNYNWTQGTMRVNGGTFIADDLMDSGIFGSIIITDGNLEFHQDISQFIDLRGDLTMEGGNFTIYGGGDNSYWPYTSNASITMSGGILDVVDNGIRIHQTNYSLTENITGGRIRTAYGFDIYRDDFTPTGGVIELYGSTDESIILTGGSYFYDLQINKSSKNYTPKIIHKKPRHPEPQTGSKDNGIIANSNLDINGDFILSAGTFDAPGKMFVAGNWQNNAGSAAFIEGMDTVYFDGNSDQYCNFEMFYNLILSKIGGNLVFHADDVFCTNYDWGSGGLHVNGGGFIVSDLVDDGIYGNITLTNGLLEFNQGSSAGEYVDLCGNLTINGGYMTVIGGSDDSYWPYLEDASINMSGGILDFQTVGINIYQSPTASFTENISGGRIKTARNLRGNRTDFTPIGGIFELYGVDDSQIGMGPGSNLYHLEINKSSKSKGILCTQTESRDGCSFKGSKANTLNLITDIDVSGYLAMDASSIFFNGYQGKFGSDVQMINNSQMLLNDNSTLMLSPISNMTMKSGSVFESIGTLGNEALVTSESGYYNFTVSTGGIICSEFTIFENMSSNGIHVNEGGIVDLAFPFNNCTFRNGENIVGSSLLTIDNSQVLTINNVAFPVLMAGGPCNAVKSENSGEITFLDPTGPFCGCVYEDDPYDRIHWQSSVGYNVALTAYLEGPFDADGMSTFLIEEDLIPLSQPYSSSPWNYPGTEYVASIPANVVDWVMIELRDATDAASANGSRTFARKAAFMLKNGYIVDLDGVSSIYFNDVFNQDLYSVVYHRNHLPVLSANPATFSAGKYSYDFSTSATQAHGSNAAHKELAPGYWGLFGGNGAIDSDINESDKINVWGPQSGNTGYLEGDYNLDGQVNNPDKNDIWIENIGNTSQIPGL